MAVYNLQALADKTKYLMSQGMTQQEAEAQVFKEANIDELDPTAYAEYTRLLTTGTNDSPYARYEEPTQEPPQEPQV
jgi:hypothetical protein